MGWQLASYGVATRILTPLVPLLLRRRLRRGKEDPLRWREKLGQASAPRPPGRLVWLHAVGLGEVLALRGLILALAEQAPDLSFLVTSSARSSAQVIAANLPPRTQHQFLPLDAPRFLQRFLAHWRPDLSIWAEQDLWPGAVAAADGAGVPLALVNARMNAVSFAKRARAAGLYSDLLSRFQLVAAQDAETARNLAALGARDVQISAPLKAAAPPLAVEEGRLSAAEAALQGRDLRLLASSHPEEEAVLLASDAFRGGPLLVIVPRDPGRGAALAEAVRATGRSATLQSAGQGPAGDVHVADAFGELGLWYRLAPAALIGGSFGPVEGHNPWEAAALGCAVLHGPRIANFQGDYAALSGACLAVGQNAAQDLLKDHSAMAARARAISAAARGSLAPLAADLLGRMA